MEKNDILKEFLNQGLQVDSAALDILMDNKKLFEEVLKIGGKGLPTVITKEFLSSLSPAHEKISVEKLSEIVKYRYMFIKKLLLDKMSGNVISINKISEKTKDFSVIGLVSTRNGNITLEDATGKDNFKADDESSKNIVEDEVVGLICSRKDGTNHINEIIFPDIPLRRSFTKGELARKAIFISGTLDKNTYDKLVDKIKIEHNATVFILGGTIPEGELKKFTSNTPYTTHVYTSTLQNHPVSVEIDTVKLLFLNGHDLDYYRKIWTDFDTLIINLLKKRNFHPTITPQSYDNRFLVETVPDIIIITDAEDTRDLNYKGTTILTMESIDKKPIYWLINLQTRETFKTVLS
ncbi:MAG: hypothetical protein HYS62_00835 [Candidatus Aenigmarchaeota archaeon]|nr:hypothetical protein [Candidatus Aenigmarchaeota archaeon]